MTFVDADGVVHTMKHKGIWAEATCGIRPKAPYGTSKTRPPTCLRCVAMPWIARASMRVLEYIKQNLKLHEVHK